MPRHRKLPPGQIGAMTGRITPYTPTGELGWLSPIRAAKSGGGYWLFRCRCDTEVSRLARNVRKSVESGATPKCAPTCKGVRAAEATV